MCYVRALLTCMFQMLVSHCNRFKEFHPIRPLRTRRWNDRASSAGTQKCSLRWHLVHLSIDRLSTKSFSRDCVQNLRRIMIVFSEFIEWYVGLLISLLKQMRRPQDKSENSSDTFRIRISIRIRRRFWKEFAQKEPICDRWTMWKWKPDSADNWAWHGSV